MGLRPYPSQEGVEPQAPGPLKTSRCGQATSKATGLEAEEMFGSGGARVCEVSNHPAVHSLQSPKGSCKLLGAPKKANLTGYTLAFIVLQLTDYKSLSHSFIMKL